jgi:hypothetical protein
MMMIIILLLVVVVVVVVVKEGTQWDSWLRHCATSQKVSGSDLVEIIGFFS